jgi:hypothetical protein
MCGNFDGNATNDRFTHDQLVSMWTVPPGVNLVGMANEMSGRPRCSQSQLALCAGWHQGLSSIRASLAESPNLRSIPCEHLDVATQPHIPCALTQLTDGSGITPLPGGNGSLGYQPPPATPGYSYSYNSNLDLKDFQFDPTCIDPNAPPAPPTPPGDGLGMLHTSPCLQRPLLAATAWSQNSKWHAWHPLISPRRAPQARPIPTLCLSRPSTTRGSRRKRNPPLAMTTRMRTRISATSASPCTTLVVWQWHRAVQRFWGSCARSCASIYSVGECSLKR